MKNLKKLLAVIVTVCVLATMTVPAFAAASDAEICEALDILRGDGAGVTDTYLAKGTERYQAAILYLRLIGKEDEAIAFTGEENFDDADLIYAGGQRILAYLKAYPDLGWTGVGGNKFEPTNPASAQMIYKVLLEALGYKQDVDFTWAETLDFAAEKGLSEIADVAELTNADVATALVEGLKAKVKDSDATLAEKLVADGIIDEEAAAELGLVELAPATLEVVSVSADNLKEVVVVFNQPVDGDTVNKDNIKIDGQDADSVELKDDKVTAVITIDDVLENQGEYKLVVSGVKSAAGVEIEKTEVSFKAFD
ncbi:MAG: Ig-like domain-containing protein, partial [Acetivibrionales bacterium]